MSQAILTRCVLFFQDNPGVYNSLPELAVILKIQPCELARNVNQLVKLSIVGRRIMDGTLSYGYLAPNDQQIQV